MSTQRRNDEATTFMSEERGKEKDSISFLSWLWWGLGGVVAFYLLSFALVFTYPGVVRAANAMGLTNDRLETIYYPIMKLIGAYR